MKVKNYLQRVVLVVLLSMLSTFGYSTVNPTADNFTPSQNTVRCADDSEGNPRYSVGECPNGYEYVPQGLIFSENFDDQLDWATTGKQTVGIIPTNWDAARTDEEWHPSVEAGTKPSMLISGDDAEKVYGGTGKAFISYSESNNALDDNGFESDGILSKDIPATKEVYVKFHLKFQPGWAANAEGGQIKMLRVGHWNPLQGTGERYKFGPQGGTAPLYFYDWAQNDYGLRQFHAFRCDSQTDNYFCTAPSIANPPRSINNGDMSAQYTSNIEPFGAQIPDLVNGGILSYDPNVYNYHNQVFGDQWNLMEFYFKLNSAAGVQDGIFKHWINGELIMSMDGIAWVGTGGDINAEWNSVAIGGNDRFHFDLEGDPVDRERWYAIDNLVIMSELPLELQ